MRAPQHNMISARFKHRLYIPVHQLFGFGSFEDPLLHQFHQAGSHLLNDFDAAGETGQCIEIKTSFERTGCSEYTDYAAL